MMLVYFLIPTTIHKIILHTIYPSTISMIIPNGRSRQFVIGICINTIVVVYEKDMCEEVGSVIQAIIKICVQISIMRFSLPV